MTTTKNYYKTSDIRIAKDSQGFYEATHRYQGNLYDYTPFNSRTEARRYAVEALREKQQEAINN